MSAIAVLIVSLGILLVWSAFANRALFVGADAAVPSVLQGKKK